MGDVVKTGRGHHYLGATSQKVVELRTQSPGMFSAEIARQVGVSRQRVSQILKKVKLPTNGVRQAHNICLQCGAQMKDKTKTGLCIKCLNKLRADRSYIELICEVCGLPFKRRARTVKVSIRRGYRHVFCSKVCQGKWLGIHHGKGHSPLVKH